MGRTGTASGKGIEIRGHVVEMKERSEAGGATETATNVAVREDSVGRRT